MFLQTQAELALGSRFKALSERLYGIANEVYRAVGIELDAHWFPVLRYLQVRGPATVTQIADAIGQTHSAVSQLASKLQRGGWIARGSDRADARRSVLELTDAGEQRLGRLGPVWCAIRRGAQAALQRSRGDLPAALAHFERAILDERVVRDILAEHARLALLEPVVVPYRPALREHFYEINAEWLERWFEIEDIDRRVLTDPKKHILDPGGAIWFALVDGEVIGTCALLQESPGVYELTKMGVRSGWRGAGAGRRLIDAAIAEFKRRRGRTLFLETNSKLAPAIALYESVGFVRQAQTRADTHYKRADVYMIYTPKAAARATVKAKAKAKRAA
jgi:DNA-binding MarR family transcriptional regulator/ribosomal protein S18 acetylase RimI-like enzyme